MITNFSTYLPLQGQDQDAPPIATDKYIIVCDGLGGDGSSKHAVDGNTEVLQKSAYLGSRKVSGICNDFFEANYEALLNPLTIKSTLMQLKNTIKAELTDYFNQNPKADNSKGGMVFPTTLAAAVFKECSTHIELTAIWAGDSRLYLFDEEKGLQQLSKDDVTGEFDACFGKDCRMSNCISQDDDFFLNYSQYQLPKNSVIFVCTDGCFDFLSSPIHFELNILACLFYSNKMNSSLETVFRKIKAGDDCTIAGAIFGFNEEELKLIANRRASIVSPLKSSFDKAEHENSISSETRAEIRKLNSENKLLNQTIVTETKKLIVSSFKEVISEKELENKDNNLLLVSNIIMKNYEPYNAYFQSLIEFSKKAEENRNLLKEFRARFDELRDLVDNAEREKRLKEKKERLASRNNQFSFGFNTNNGLGTVLFGGRNNNQYIFEQQSDIQRNCYLQIEQLENLLLSIKSNPNGYANHDARHQLRAQADYIAYSLKQLENCNSQIFENNRREKSTILSDSELNQTVMPKIISGGVQCYRGVIDESDYDELSGVYEEYLILRNNIESAGDISERDKTFDEKVNDFENVFLKDHLIKISEIINNDAELRSNIPAISEYQNNLKRLEEIQNSLSNGNEQQRSIWNQYRINYEAYKKCINTGTC